MYSVKCIYIYTYIYIYVYIFIYIYIYIYIYIHITCCISANPSSDEFLGLTVIVLSAQPLWRELYDMKNTHTHKVSCFLFQLHRRDDIILPRVNPNIYIYNNVSHFFV